jgi:hypothetical protein
MTAYSGQALTPMTLGQLCTTLWDHPTARSAVTPLVLRCSALDHSGAPTFTLGCP